MAISQQIQVICLDEIVVLIYRIVIIKFRHLVHSDYACEWEMTISCIPEVSTEILLLISQSVIAMLDKIQLQLFSIEKFYSQPALTFILTFKETRE